MSVIKCSRCSKTVDADAFIIIQRDGNKKISNVCNQCRSDISKEHKVRFCLKCKEYKNLFHFDKDKNYYKNWCRECIEKYGEPKKPDFVVKQRVNESENDLFITNDESYEKMKIILLTHKNLIMNKKTYAKHKKNFTSWFKQIFNCDPLLSECDNCYLITVKR